MVNITKAIDYFIDHSSLEVSLSDIDLIAQYTVDHDINLNKFYLARRYILSYADRKEGATKIYTINYNRIIEFFPDYKNKIEKMLKKKRAVGK